MTKYERYQDYVIKDGKLVGEFEQMYQDFEDPWEQTLHETNASEKIICVNLIKRFSLNNIIELGCGFGHLTNQVSKVCDSVLGVDISPTAINTAKKKYKDCKFEVSNFSNFEKIKTVRPDCIIMSEITWYVLDHLDDFILLLKKEMPNTILIHMLTTYNNKNQTYGADKFTNLDEIKNYFGMNYIESGEIERQDSSGSKRTYFIGKYDN